MSEIPNGLERSLNTGEQAPLTLAKRLRQGIPDILKDFVGVATRMVTYIGTTVAGEMVGAAIGLDKNTSINIGVVAMTANIIAGETYYMKRLGRVLPLVRADRSGWWEKKRGS